MGTAWGYWRNTCQDSAENHEVGNHSLQCKEDAQRGKMVYSVTCSDSLRGKYLVIYSVTCSDSLRGELDLVTYSNAHQACYRVE
jgi:hypothetical protein